MDYRIASSRTAVKEFLEYIVEEFKNMGLAPKDIFDIRAILRESVINGILHGNKLDRSKYVDVSIEIKGPEVCIRVWDEGGGFDIQNIGQYTKHPEKFTPHGRGISMIYQSSNYMFYSHQGSCLTVYKKLDQGNKGV